MDPLYKALISLFFMLGPVGIFITLMVIDSKYGEVIRPLIGILTFRKPKIPNKLDIATLFKIGNNHRHVTTSEEFWYSYDRLEKYVQENSWYRKRDLRNLKLAGEIMIAAIRDHERAERMKRMNHQKSKASSGSAPKKNKPITGWRKILGVADDCADPKVIKTCYRKLVSKDHPDKGGKGLKMPEYNRALDAARSELKFV